MNERGNKKEGVGGRGRRRSGIRKRSEETQIDEKCMRREGKWKRKREGGRE